MGSIPDFNRGAVVAIVMLLPSIISIALLCYLQRYNVRYNKISQVELKVNKVRDFVWGGFIYCYFSDDFIHVRCNLHDTIY